MKVCEKIKRLRQDKGWSQEEIANKLNMSTNAYGCIERGDTDVSLSRLEDISAVFEIDIADFFDKKIGVFNLGGTQNNQQNWCQVHNSIDNLKNQIELEKSQLIIEKLEVTIQAQQSEINYLKEINELMKAKS
jgi:transcriptional regulator with XRE-family HTH domain